LRSFNDEGKEKMLENIEFDKKMWIDALKSWQRFQQLVATKSIDYVKESREKCFRALKATLTMLCKPH
jgi:hypothetical protein